MTTALAVAALILAAAALTLAIIVMRQSATALTAARRATTHGDRLAELEDDVTDVQAYTAQLAGWAGDAEHRIAGLVARVGLPGEPTPRSDEQPARVVVVEHPITADQAAQIRDHLRDDPPPPTTAMPAQDRPRP